MTTTPKFFQQITVPTRGIERLQLEPEDPDLARLTHAGLLWNTLSTSPLTLRGGTSRSSESPRVYNGGFSITETPEGFVTESTAPWGLAMSNSPYPTLAAAVTALLTAYALRGEGR